MNVNVTAIALIFLAAHPYPAAATPDVTSWMKIQSPNVQQAPNWINDQAANLRQRLEGPNDSNSGSLSADRFSWQKGFNDVQSNASSLGQKVDQGARTVGNEWFSLANYSNYFLGRAGQDLQRLGLAVKAGANGALTQLDSLLQWLQIHVQQLKSQTS